jgi:hypothetical protein
MQKLNTKIESFYIDSNICGDFPPMFYRNPSKTQKILSLGLNPSLTSDFEDILKERKLTFKDFIESKNIEEREKKIEDIINYQDELKYGVNEKKPIPYFNHLTNFFSQLKKNEYNNFKENVYHYDLFQIRKTDSKEVISVFKNELLQEVFGHLEYVISEINPEIIFVFNATVSGILKEQNLFFKNQKIDEQDGCYYYKGIPVILTNQLSGGATSSVYRELLIWNVNRILNKK